MTSDWDWRHLVGGHWTLRETPIIESELEFLGERILWGPLVIRAPEYLFAEDLIVDDSGAPDATLPILAKVSSLIEVLRLGGPYELLYKLWSKFTLTVSRRNVDVTWSRHEVLVDIFLVPCVYVSMCISLLVGCFSRSFWTGFTPASFLVCSDGWRCMGSTVYDLSSAAQNFGWWWGRGREPHSSVFVLRCWVDSAPILHWRLRFWDKFGTLLV